VMIKATDYSKDGRFILRCSGVPTATSLEFGSHEVIRSQ